MDKFWYNSEDSQLGKWQRQIEEKTGSCSFCVLPWIHFATRPNGDIRLCCVANSSGASTGDYTGGLIKKEDGTPANASSTTPLEAWNGDFMKSVRTTMLKGEIPNSCRKCFEEERDGVASKRIWETGFWYREGLDIHDLLSQTQQDGTVPDKIQYLDLRLGHTCNLKCIMCSPHDSSMWVNDHKKVYDQFEHKLIKDQMAWSRIGFNNQWHESEAFWNDLYKQIPYLKQVYFAGGEPLIIKEHKRFLKEIIKQGYAKNILVRYNSNGLLIDDEILEIWNEFRKVKFGFSLDAVGERNHYIRYPSDWDTIVENLHKLDNTPDHIHVSIATAVQILNIKHLPDMVKWKLSQNFKKINMQTVEGSNDTGDSVQLGGGMINLHLVWIPTYLNIRLLPEQDKQEVRRIFSEFKDWLWNNYRQDDNFWKHNPYGWKRWEAILDHMDSEDQSKILPAFKNYINTMDAHRKIDAKQIFPELSHLI